MARNRIFLIGALAGLVTCSLILWQYRAAAHDTPALSLTQASEITPFSVKIDPEGAFKAHIPIENGSTSGQLTLLDKQGRQAGICPLQHTDVQADIAGYVSRVTVTQEFANASNTPIEALYTFPLPEDAAVDDMTLIIGTRIIKSQILRREEAREVYEAAKTTGHTAALMDQERPNIFTQSVANIMPGEKIKISLSYVNLLKYQQGQYEFVFPMVVGPRYIPSGGGAARAGLRSAQPSESNGFDDPAKKPIVTDAEKITPPITPPGTRSGHDISVTVHLDAGLPLREIHSTLHAVDAKAQSLNCAIIRLTEKDSLPNRDFILHYTAAGSDLQSGILTYAPQRTAKGSQVTAQGGYFTLIVQPPTAPAREKITPKEMVFVIDQTGSQSGWPIAKAKETMRHCIQNLNPGDTFQLLGFNTQLFPCFEKPVPATAQTVAKALKFLEPIEGNGGTDILKSVDYALSLPDDPDRLRIVCYMTDGYVGNDMQIIDSVQKHRGRARMFPFGCGNSVNRFLIEGMAREGRGVSEYVTLQSDAQEAARRFYARIADPLLLDISVDWNGLPIEDVYPQHIPDVFSAQPILIKGRYTKPGEGDITIHGLLRGKPWQQTLHLTLPAAKGEGSAIETLWAREKIEDLQNRDWMGTQSNHPDPKIHEHIVATALEYRLMSQYTSFVAVEEKTVNFGGKQRTVEVPVEMPQGVSYEGIFGGKNLQEQQMNFGFQYSRGASRPQANGYPGLSAGVPGSGGSFGAGSRSTSPGHSGSFGGRAAAKAAPASPGLLSDDKSALTAPAAYSDQEVAAGTEQAKKTLSAMKPEERKTALRQAKLASALRTLSETFAIEGKNGGLDKAGLPKVENGRLEVQVWLNSLPLDGLQQLKALGFDLSATLQPNKLLLGTVAVDKLDQLIELGFVRRVESPRIK